MPLKEDSVISGLWKNELPGQEIIEYSAIAPKVFHFFHFFTFFPLFPLVVIVVYSFKNFFF